MFLTVMVSEQKLSTGVPISICWPGDAVPWNVEDPKPADLFAETADAGKPRPTGC